MSETRDRCMMCGAAEPAAGWHTAGYSDGDVELFCSAKCFNDNCDYHDDDDEISDGEADCGRWSNGRLEHQCSQAGTEWCDWECPVGIEGRKSRPNKRQATLDLPEQLSMSQRPEGNNGQ
jgi:hypothetical protein